jgi:hypothetical protein
MPNLFRLSLVTLGLTSAFVARTPLLAQSAQPTAAELRAKVVQNLPGWLKQYHVPSVAVAYIAGGKLAWSVVAGEQSPGVPASVMTLLAEPYGKEGFTQPAVISTWNAADNVETTATDYAHFVTSVMHNEGLSPAIAAQRLVMTRDWVPDDAATQVCAYEVPGTPCHISAGMGLGWQVIVHNGVTIVDHSGADPGAHTHAFFIPGKQIGVVVFTNGENGPKVIGEIVRVLYPDPVYAATVSQ